MKGNPLAQNRFQWKLYTVDTDEPIDGYWEQLKKDAIYTGCQNLVREFNKFGTTNLVVKVWNCMNTKQPPMVITLDEAKVILNK